MVDVGDNDHRSAGCRSVVVYKETRDEGPTSGRRHSTAFTEASTGLSKAAAYDVNRGKLNFRL
jgi:hypothetical protein